MASTAPLARSDVKSAYQSRLVSTDEAVRAIRPGDVVHYGGFCGAVYDLDEALARRIHELKDIKIITSIWPYEHKPAIVREDPRAEHVRWQTTQFSPIERQMNREGLCWYIPVQYREQLKYWRQDTKIDVSMLQVAPMDRHGFFNIGPQVSDAMAVVERARREGLAGATVLAGVEGFGQNHVLLTQHPWRFANDREVVVELVDTEETLAGFLARIEPMIRDAIVTTERAHVVFYRRKGEAPS